MKADAKLLLEIRRLELGRFFRQQLGEPWRKLLAARLATTEPSLRKLWPLSDHFTPRPHAYTDEVFVKVEQFARSKGFSSMLDVPTRRVLRDLFAYYRALDKPVPSAQPEILRSAEYSAMSVA